MRGRKKQPDTLVKQPYRRRYSVYRKGTDEPIVINGTSEQCAAAMSITTNSFYRYLVRSEHGIKGRKYEIFVDDPDEELEDIEC